MEPSPAFHPSDRGLLARSHLQVESQCHHAGTPPPLTDPLLVVVALAAAVVVVVVVIVGYAVVGVSVGFSWSR